MFSKKGLKSRLAGFESSVVEKTLIQTMDLVAVDMHRLRRASQKNLSVLQFVAFQNCRAQDYAGTPTPYFQKITSYILTLSATLTQRQFEAILADEKVDEGEIDALFSEPRKISPEWHKAPHFGFVWQDKAYNFDNTLRLLLKINFLKGSLLRTDLSLQWQNEKLQLLKKAVDDYVNEIGPNVFTFETLTSEDQYRLIPDDTHDYENPFGYASYNPRIYWPAYWDAYWFVKPNPMLQDPSLYPLQMQNAKAYPWYERALYFLTGGDVRKYFKDQWRLTELLYSQFIKDISKYYNLSYRSYPLGKIADFYINLLFMLFADFPTALVKGLLSLPFRAMRALVNTCFDEFSIFWKIGMNTINLLELVLTLGIFLILRIPVGAIVGLTSMVVGSAFSLVTGIGAVIAKHFVKPVIEFFASNEEEDEEEVSLEEDFIPEPTTTQRLLAQLTRIQVKLGEADRIVIQDHELSKQEVLDAAIALRQKKPLPQNLDWLLEITDFSKAMTAGIFNPRPVPIVEDPLALLDVEAAPASTVQY